MPRRGHREEQILQALRLAESGAKAVEVCRRMGIGEQTFYIWRRKYAGLGLSELRELAASRVRFGYRRLTVLLTREGWPVNAKRIYRL